MGIQIESPQIPTTQGSGTRWKAMVESYLTQLLPARERGLGLGIGSH